MRGTMIVYAHPEKFRILADNGRFSPTRTGLFERLYAAWLVFSERADALYWPPSWPRY